MVGPREPRGAARHPYFAAVAIRGRADALPGERWNAGEVNETTNPAPAAGLAAGLLNEGGGTMNDWMDGSDWIWMTFSMTIGIVVLGAVIYAAVRLANRDSRPQR
ncbi:MAG: hypothetical protein ABI649_08505 [Gaiellaceae bacterium]